MIRNEKEYRSTRAALVGYEEAISKFDVLKIIESGVDPVIARAQLASYGRQSSELREKLKAYEALRDDDTAQLRAHDLAEIGRCLVEARVARGLTQRELANLAGLQEQQIQRYEKDYYISASLRRLTHIASTIGVTFDATLTLIGAGVAVDDGLPNGLSVADFPFAEMNNRRWFGAPEELRRAPLSQKLSALREFFTEAPLEMHLALHRKTAGAISPARSAALMAWQARVLMKARQLTGLARRFNTPPAEVVSKIAKLSAENHGIKKAVDLLLQYGIIVVFVRHLAKTKIDGAAMSLNRGEYAVIGITARHNRVDNFWFVLLHELGHISRHWQRVVEIGLVEEEAGEDYEDLMEREANEFAENAILPMATWLASTVRFAKLESSIREFASRYSLHPALIAGRIRRERGYTEFHDMLGSGEVREYLSSAGLMDAE